jgi:hypothetical protein
MNCPPENTAEENIQLIRARLLIQRLERLSADSTWAHKASGIRASLAKLLTRMEDSETDPDRLDSLVQFGFDILGKAAEDIPSPEDISGTS